MNIQDPIVKKVVDKFVQRSNVGIEKYGTTLEDNNLSILGWIQHTQEELMDAILYLEKLKQVTMDEMIDKSIDHLNCCSTSSSDM
jgi:hypothetical protein